MPTHVTNDVRTNEERTSHTHTPTGLGLCTHIFPSFVPTDSLFGPYGLFVLSVRTFLFVRTDFFVCRHGPLGGNRWFRARQRCYPLHMEALEKNVLQFWYTCDHTGQCIYGSPRFVKSFIVSHTKVNQRRIMVYTRL